MLRSGGELVGDLPCFVEKLVGWRAEAYQADALGLLTVDELRREQVILGLRHGLVRAARRFGLNVVGRGSRSLEDFFYSPAAKAEDNLGAFATIDAPSGVPLLAEALAGFDCAVVDEREAGDHTLFIARVEWARRGGADSPLSTLDLDYVYLGTGRIVKR